MGFGLYSCPGEVRHAWDALFRESTRPSFSWKFRVFQSSTTAEIELTPQPECTLPGLGHCLEGPGGLNPLQIFWTLSFFDSTAPESISPWALGFYSCPGEVRHAWDALFRESTRPPSFSWRFHVFQSSTTAEIELTPPARVHPPWLGSLP